MSGVSLEAFSSRGMAVEAFFGMVKEDVQAADEVAILEIDDEGNAVDRVEVDGSLAQLARRDLLRTRLVHRRQARTAGPLCPVTAPVRVPDRSG